MNQSRGVWFERILPAFVALVVVLATLAFIGRVDPIRSYLSSLALPGLLATLTLLASLGVGFVLRRGVEFTFGVEPARDRIVSAIPVGIFDLVTGFPLYGTLCYLLATVSLSAGALGWLLCTLAIVGALRLPASMRSLGGTHVLGAGAIFALVLIGIAFAIELTVAQAPPATLDEVAYHLTVSKIWVSEGSVVDLPLLSHALFPFGPQSASLPLLALLQEGGGIASHLVHWAISIAVAFAAFSWLRTKVDVADAAVGTAVIVCTPALLMTAGVTWVDWTVLGVSIVTVAVIHYVLEDPRARSSALAYVATPVAAGMVTKYTFLALLAPCWVVLLATAWRHGLPKKGLAKVTIVAGIMGSPFLIRNIVWRGNPFAPFFESSTPNVQSYVEGASWADVVGSYVYSPLLSDEAIGLALPCMILTGFAASLTLFRNRALRAIFFAALLPLCGVMALKPSSRILLPFACIVAIAGWMAFSPLLSSFRAKALVRGSFCLLTAVQLYFVASAVGLSNPFIVLAEGGAIQYVDKARPTTKTIRWIDTQLPDESRTLVIGIHELYWFEHRVRGGANFDGPLMAEFIGEDGPDAFLARLKEESITHLVVHSPGVIVGNSKQRGRRAERQTPLNEAQERTLRSVLDDHSDRIAGTDKTAIFRLRSADR